MLAGEDHIGAPSGERLITNLHMADTNRRALGRGLLDLDAVLMALYAVGYTEGDRSARPSRSHRGATTLDEIDRDAAGIPGRGGLRVRGASGPRCRWTTASARSSGVEPW